MSRDACISRCCPLDLFDGVDSGGRAGGNGGGNHKNVAPHVKIAKDPPEGALDCIYVPSIKLRRRNDGGDRHSTRDIREIISM